jgi:hypothetical protein
MLEDEIAFFRPVISRGCIDREKKVILCLMRYAEEPNQALEPTPTVRGFDDE